MDLLQNVFLGNSLQAWTVAVAIALVTFAALRFIVTRVLRRLARLADRTENRWDDVIAAAMKATNSALVLVLAVFAGASVLTLEPRVMSVLRSVTIISLLVQGGLWISAGIKGWIAVQREVREADEAATVMTMNVLGIAARIVLWSMVLLLILDNLGIDVTALVAGLGIGGVAVALAAQNILGDLFASLSIVLDRPFVLGDFLVMGEHMGSVEEIGLKTTRIRSLSGEQLVFSNADLLSSRIRNYGRMYERRVSFKLGVTYQTPRDTLQLIPAIVREAVESAGEQVRFDRSHLQAYGDFAIVFETVFYVASPDYAVFMDLQQAIYLRIHERFEEEGIEFAYPTQTLFVERAG
jgi:small-conductance mechanosensitive channel